MQPGPARKDEVGMRFGWLEVVGCGPDRRYAYTRHRTYIVFCHRCGRLKDKPVLRRSLLSKDSTIVSCGCFQRESRFRDYTGFEWGGLKILRLGPKDHRGRTQWYVQCLVCGKPPYLLEGCCVGVSQSCGCQTAKINRELKTTHGDYGSKEYRTWASIKQACSNPKHRSYPWYGARGIEVCQRWQAYENFLADMSRAPAAESRLERIDKEWDYEPGNCRWTAEGGLTCI